ncbi:MAG: transcriptional regulator NrdR [Alphaproteobacteria bacterium]|nr:transcriptional regulator NrdR [Alphaproteobacteria bacterium]
MRCPFCGADDTQVKDSRPTEDNAAIRRRRVCVQCGARFTTFERVQLRDMIVLKKNGDKEIFDREKLLRSMRVALRKRPVDDEKIEQITNTVVRELESLGEAEISAVSIGEHVMKALRDLDLVGYVRYASVYRDFRSPGDFENFVDTLRKETV